jgi:hypothetical protein
MVSLKFSRSAGGAFNAGPEAYRRQWIVSDITIVHSASQLFRQTCTGTVRFGLIS